jgi:hypothetical protein
MFGGEEAAEITLRWEAGVWCAAGAGIDASHADLAALDALIVEELARTRAASTANVRFDIGRLPAWLRQYQSHYFNYVLRVDGGESE